MGLSPSKTTKRAVADAIHRPRSGYCRTVAKNRARCLMQRCGCPVARLDFWRAAEMCWSTRMQQSVTKKHLLFLSHSGADAPAALALRERILKSPEAKQYGLDVFVDVPDLR